MRALLVLLVFLSACDGVEATDAGASSDAQPLEQDSGAPPVLLEDAPEVDGEGRYFVSTGADRRESLVRLRANGEITDIEIPVRRSTDLIVRQDRVGRRALLIDVETTRTFALRADGWDELCDAIESESCRPWRRSEDLSRFLLLPAFGDADGVFPVLLGYRGERFAGVNGRYAVHSDAGWTVASLEDGSFALIEDGVASPLALTDAEPLFAIGETLFAQSSSGDLVRVDPATGASEEVTCAGGERPAWTTRGITRFERCGAAWLELTASGLEPTGNAAEDPADYAVHVEPAAYSFGVRGIDERASAAVVWAADGEVLAEREHQVVGPEETSGTLIYGFRADPERVVAYVSSARVVDATITPEARDDAIFLWERGSAPEIHPVPRDDARNDYAREESIWFPVSSDRAYWVTRNRRLVGFDYRTREWLDVGGERRFDR